MRNRNKYRSPFRVKVSERDRSLSSTAIAIGHVGSMVEKWENTLSSSLTTRRAKDTAERQLRKWLPVLSMLTQRSISENMIEHRAMPVTCKLAFDYRSFVISKKKRAI